MPRLKKKHEKWVQRPFRDLASLGPREKRVNRANCYQSLLEHEKEDIENEKEIPSAFFQEHFGENRVESITLAFLKKKESLERYLRRGIREDDDDLTEALQEAKHNEEKEKENEKEQVHEMVKEKEKEKEEKKETSQKRKRLQKIEITSSSYRPLFDLVSSNLYTCPLKPDFHRKEGGHTHKKIFKAA